MATTMRQSIVMIALLGSDRIGKMPRKTKHSPSRAKQRWKHQARIAQRKQRKPTRQTKSGSIKRAATSAESQQSSLERKCLTKTCEQRGFAMCRRPRVIFYGRNSLTRLRMNRRTGRILQSETAHSTDHNPSDSGIHLYS